MWNDFTKITTKARNFLRTPAKFRIIGQNQIRPHSTPSRSWTENFFVEFYITCSSIRIETIIGVPFFPDPGKFAPSWIRSSPI